MKRLVLFFAIVALLFAFKGNSEPRPTPAQETKSEFATSYNYDIVYRWGFIEKTAASCTVTLARADSVVTGTINGHSIDWEGRYYSISDTLTAEFADLDGIITQRNLKAIGWYFKPTVPELPAGFFDDPANYKTTHGTGTLNADDATMEAVSVTVDMIGFYTVAQMIDFDSLNPGDRVTVPIKDADGSTQTLTVTYNGRSIYQGREVFQTVFNYTCGSQMSAYPVSSQVDVDSRVPLTIAADLLIGHVEMQLRP